VKALLANLFLVTNPLYQIPKPVQLKHLIESCTQSKKSSLAFSIPKYFSIISYSVIYITQVAFTDGMEAEQLWGKSGPGADEGRLMGVGD
jgi:hypothetical protein